MSDTMATEPREGRAVRRTDPRRHLVALALLLFMFGLAYASERGRSPTADEPNHLARGVAWWRAPDARLSSAHPPLGNAIAALPAALADPDVDFEALAGWEDAQIVSISRAYFRRDYARGRHFLHLARLVNILFAVALAGYLYLWTDRRWGWPTAPFALALLVLQPTILAHARLMTTDLPIVLAAFVAATAALGYAERRGPWPWVGLCAAACLMVGIKHSGGPLFVILSLIIMVWAGAGWGRFEGRPRWKALAEAAGHLFAIGLVIILFINLLYRFEGTGLTVQQILDAPEPHSWVARRYDGGVITPKGPLGHLPRGLPIPLPYTYVAGLFTVRAQNAMGHGEYFFGLRDHPGHPLYFPTLLVIKSPVGLLGLLGVTLGLAARRWRSLSSATRFLLAFAGLFLASVMSSKINIGIRHAMLLLPIAAVFCGRGAALLWTPDLDAPTTPGWLRRGAVGLAIGACLVAVIWPFPRYLGYFNWLVGGPEGGLQVSVIAEDWGQDVGDAAGELQRRDLPGPVYYYSMFALRFDELEAHGLETRRLRCGRPPPPGSTVLLHRTDLVRRGAACFSWTTDVEPEAVVGHHVFLYVAP